MNLLTHRTLTNLQSTLTEEISGKDQGKIPFTISEPEFDESTFYGRFEAFRRTMNPIHSVYPNKNILFMKTLLE